MKHLFPRELAWMIRALPIVVAAAGAATNRWPGLFIGLAAGWVLAVLLANMFVWVLPRATHLQAARQPEASPATETQAEPPTTAPAPAEPELTSTPPPAPAPPRTARPARQPQTGSPTFPGSTKKRKVRPPAQPHPAAYLKARGVGPHVEIIEPDEATIQLMADLAAAEDEARRIAGGFLSNDYVLIADRLESFATFDADNVWVRCRLDEGHGGRPIGAVREHWDHTWIRPVPNNRVRCEVRYRARADHTDGGILVLRSVTRAGAVRAEWHRGDNHDVVKTIPEGFQWEKNDDYYYGYVPMESLTNIREERERILLGYR